MKKLLPILLCYVLMTSQVFAISGGPTFGSGRVSPIGTYSGVLVGTQTSGSSTTTTFTGNFPTDSGGQNAQSEAASVLGLFSISVPSSSIASGAFLLFTGDGGVFTGNIDASIDPDSNQFSGIVFGYKFQQEPSNASSGGTIAVETGYAAGAITAKISPGSQASTGARIKGTAKLGVTNLAIDGNTSGQFQLVCTVTGFRQSTTASAISNLPTLTNNNQ